MRTSALRAFGWCGIGAIVVMGARVVAYALAPQRSVLSFRLEHAAGGPRLVVVTACALGIALVAAGTIVGLAALAVRERRAISSEVVVSPPRLEPQRLAIRLLGLFVASSTAFWLLESYLHWRAGLGWHGIGCLLGPVHRDAIPVLAALSVVAASVVEAVAHLLAWARRTIARFLAEPRPSRARPRACAIPCLIVTNPLWLCAPLLARGPPA